MTMICVFWSEGDFYMDTITMEELKTFLARPPGWHVSLFMPTHRAGRRTEQDPIRFRNLLREAEERLLSKSLRSTDVREMLKPAERLGQEPRFWRNQSHGLAVFLTAEEFHLYRLPLPFEELVVISQVFHVKPLLPFFASDGHFYILTLSQNQVRLLQGTRHTVDKIDLESMPESMAEALQYERFERQLQSHSDTSSGTGSRSTTFHGHGVGDRPKNRILRWFRVIDRELPNLLTGKQSPLVLAGVEYLFPLYRQANTYPHLLDDKYVSPSSRRGNCRQPGGANAGRTTYPGLAARAAHVHGSTRRRGGSIQSIGRYGREHCGCEGGRLGRASRADRCAVCRSWHSSVGQV